MQTAGQFETRYLNRMATMLQSAFDQACCENDIAAAEELLSVLETVLYRAATRDEHRERSMTVLQSAFSSMWQTKRTLHGAAVPAPATPERLNVAVEAYDTRHIVQNEARQAF